MANNGIIERKFAGGSYGGYYLGVEWRVNSQSTSGNSSNVTATVFLRTTGNGYTINSSATKDVSVTINGTKYLSTCTVGIGSNTRKNLFSKTVTVPHNSDGSKTCSFACALDINVTLSGNWYGKVTHSGEGYFDKINLNTPPTMSGYIRVSPSGTIPENTNVLNLSWDKAGDAQGNANKYQIYRYINGQHNKTINIDNINTTSCQDNISEFGQGTKIDYTIWAMDTYGAWSNAIYSYSVTKNKYTGAWFSGHSNDIAWDTNTFTVSLTGASNSNGNGSFRYVIYSDDITVYNQREITSTSETITIWKGGATPNTPYIKFEDLKNKFRNSGFNGRLHIGVKTINAYGSVAWNGGSVGVDLRVAPNKPTKVTIAGGTALKTIPNTNNKYYIPNGSDTIVINWEGGNDKIGEQHQYRIYQILDGTVTLKDTVSGSTHSYSIVLPKQSTTRTLAFRIHTLTSYGYSDYRDSSAVTLHYYNPPSINVDKVDRTDTTATAHITLKANTSIPNVNFPTRSFSGASSGTLQNTQNQQTITANKLNGGNKYEWTITLKDDTGLYSSNITQKIEIPAYTPLFSVREKGVGINVIPDGSAGLMVKKGAKIEGGLTVDGKKVLTDENQFIKASQLTDGNNVYGRIPQIAGDGVIELGRYIDFHLPNSKADFDGRLTLQDNKVLRYNGWMQADAFQGGNLRISGNDFCMNNKRALVGWAGANDPLIINFGGDFKGGIKMEGYTQVTGQIDAISEPGVWGSHIRTATNKDGNGDGDGNTHIGYNSGNGYSHYFRGKGAFYIDNHLGLKTNKVDATQWIQAPELWVKSNGGVYSGHNNAYILKDHGNGNVTLSGAGGQLYLGYHNTTSIKVEQEYWDLGASSGCMLRLSSPWSGTGGSEPAIFNSKGKGWGFLGNSDWSWYRIYGASGSVSERHTKYDIHKFDDALLYEYVKDINTYAYRTVSDVKDDEGNHLETLKRSDMQLGCMIEEMPTEVVFYDEEGGNGGAVDNYSYATMILGATKVLQNKTEKLEEEVENLKNENEELRSENEDLKNRLGEIERILKENGIN